jgi:hypothetical protein
MIECSATCKCGTYSWHVRYRKPDEDLLEWLHKIVRPAMGEAHRIHCAICTETKGDLKIPCPEGSPGLGMKP